MPELKTRKHIRLANYDYSANGYYFITFCSKNRENKFGNSVGALLACARKNNTVTDDHFELSACGQIIERQWLDLPNQYDNVELDEYVIMPHSAEPTTGIWRRHHIYRGNLQKAVIRQEYNGVFHYRPIGNITSK